MAPDSPARPRRFRVGVALAVLAVALMPLSRAVPEEPAWQVYFSPNHGATKAVVDALDAAKTTVLVQAYSFTSALIAKALVEAHDRGVDVQVILDRKETGSKYSSADFVAHAGISLACPSPETRQMRQLPTIGSVGYQQSVGISMPDARAASRIVWPSSALSLRPSIVIVATLNR